MNSVEDKELSEFAQVVISVFEEGGEERSGGRLTVNPLISKVASLYEKLRNAMEYREEEVVLRNSIERILKRRLITFGEKRKIAEPLIRELVWARYFSGENLSESFIKEVEDKIRLYLELKHQLLKNKALKEGELNEWIYHLISATIEQMLRKNREKETIASLMFQILKEAVVIEDDNEQTKNAQIFIAIRRSYAKDDIAFLRFHLFHQYFGDLTFESLESVASRFVEGYKEIQYQLHYPRKDTIFSYVKNKTGVFFILEDFLRIYKGQIREIAQNSEELKRAVIEACEARYSGIQAKVQRAIVRSVLFILLTKVIFAFAVEGTIENIFYGRILWAAMTVNVLVPPFLMVLVGFFIKTPGKYNSQRIYQYIQTILFDEKPRLGGPLVIRKKPEKKTALSIIFTLLWFLAFFLSFGLVMFVLSKLNFHIVSQFIFLFFLAIVSFLTYRIGRTARTYTVEERQGALTPLIDFFFMPIVRVGRSLTEGISQINIFLFIFDFIIETPFKGLFTFFEQWFFYLHTKREGLE